MLTLMGSQTDRVNGSLTQGQDCVLSMCTDKWKWLVHPSQITRDKVIIVRNWATGLLKEYNSNSPADHEIGSSASKFSEGAAPWLQPEVGSYQSSDFSHQTLERGAKQPNWLAQFHSSCRNVCGFSEAFSLKITFHETMFRVERHLQIQFDQAFVKFCWQP